MDIIKDVLLDSLKMLPLLFVVYAVIEFLEHKNNNSSYHILMKQKKLGPFLGAVFGCIPQCGFSVIASDLYSRRAITVGTLLAVFLSTSDEAVPILITNPSFFPDALKILGIKLIIAAVFGYIADFIIKTETGHECEKKESHTHFHGNCEPCDHGILRSALIHSAKIFVFIFLVSLALEFVMENAVGDNVFDFFNTHTVLQPFLTALVGLIPNCAASVILTQCFIAGKITLGALIGGLCTGAGVGLVVLFKFNKNTAQNFLILISLYLCGVFSGIILQMIL